MHTPALLPKSLVDLNIPVLTQVAGMAGILLYLGTGGRRMAEVAVGELNRKGLAISNPITENCEVYVVSISIAFGMIMLGRGANCHECC